MAVELEITWPRVLHVWWAYLWRSLLAMVAAFLAAFAVSFLVGFILRAFGVEEATIKLILAPVGFLIGVGISVVPLRLILGKDFGEFRLVLLSNEIR